MDYIFWADGQFRVERRKAERGEKYWVHREQMFYELSNIGRHRLGTFRFNASWVGLNEAANLAYEPIPYYDRINPNGDVEHQLRAEIRRISEEMGTRYTVSPVGPNSDVLFIPIQEMIDDAESWDEDIPSDI